MTGADHSEADTPERDPLNIVQNASMAGQAIRCNPSDGPQVDFLHIGAIQPMQWLAWRESDESPRVVHRDVPVWVVRQSLPSVFTIEEEQSRWGDGDA